MPNKYTEANNWILRVINLSQLVDQQIVNERFCIPRLGRLNTDDCYDSVQKVKMHFGVMSEVNVVIIVPIH